MKAMDYLAETDIAVTVCDLEGTILYMNLKSMATFADDGGAALIGKSLIDCHPEPARSKLLDLLAAPRVNVYTIEKSGVRKMIYQLPWLDEGQVKGLIELSLPLPVEIPNFIRG
jgi:transcriptional regulator with PAS, ATPase and Fis domain